MTALHLALALGAMLPAMPAKAAEAAGATPPELHLYAAASLREALEALVPEVERETRTRLVLNLGASSDLARQILAAGRADLFFSADEAWMDRLAATGLVDAAARCSPLSNRLVVVVPADSPLQIRSGADLAAPAIERLSLANPEAVPAGRYAKAWLEAAGSWSAVAGRVVPAIDARAALAAVETGAIDAGVVYRTDAMLSRRVRIAFAVPEGESPRISYALAALAGRPQLTAARAVAAWLCGLRAAEVFTRFGFGAGASAP